jgi:hypothetical protein
VFGSTNLAAVRAGKTGKDCRGEEHRVELVFSLKSGKTKARIYWNKRNISNLFRDLGTNGMVNAAWTSRSGEKVHVVARAHEVPGEIQYELFVDGTSFNTLPSVSSLGRGSSDRSPSPLETRDQQSSSSEYLKRDDSNSVLSGLESSGDELSAQPMEALGFRLSMVGLKTVELDPKDELHSNLYSTLFQSLRQQITEYLPQTEDMISRAIINAFYMDSSSWEGGSSMSDISALEPDPNQIEADYAWEAHQWVGLNVDYAPRPDAEEQALSFMQKQIDEVFVRIRNEELTSDAACRIILSVACILGLEMAQSVSKDTIILNGLDNNTTTVDDLHRHLSTFGKVEAAAIARCRHGFGFCRFKDESAAAQALVAFENDTLVIGAAMPKVSVVSENMRVASERSTTLDADRELVGRDVSCDEKEAWPMPPVCLPYVMSPLTIDNVDDDLLMRSPTAVFYTSTTTPIPGHRRRPSDLTPSLTSTIADSVDDDVLMRSPATVCYTKTPIPGQRRPSDFTPSLTSTTAGSTESGSYLLTPLGGYR